MKRYALCKLNKRREETEQQQKLFVNITGKISSKVVFIVEHKEKRRWLMGKFKFIVVLNTPFFQYKLNPAHELVWPPISRLIRTENQLTA